MSDIPEEICIHRVRKRTTFYGDTRDFQTQRERGEGGREREREREKKNGREKGRARERREVPDEISYMTCM